MKKNKQVHITWMHILLSEPCLPYASWWQSPAARCRREPWRGTPGSSRPLLTTPSCWQCPPGTVAIGDWTAAGVRLSRALEPAAPATAQAHLGKWNKRLKKSDLWNKTFIWTYKPKYGSTPWFHVPCVSIVLELILFLLVLHRHPVNKLKLLKDMLIKIQS